jgi:hypothetical protein
MAEDNKPVAPPDWVSKTLATLDAISGYTYAALAIAAALILFIPSSTFGVDLAPIRKAWGAWLFAAMIALALLAIAKVVRAIHPLVGKGLLALSARRARKMKRAEILSHLDSLSEEERNLLAHCVSTNQRSIIGNYLNGALTMLVSKGLFQMAPNPIFTPARMPYLIPDFVWAELQKRKAQFQYKEPPPGERGTGWMRY